MGASARTLRRPLPGIPAHATPRASPSSALPWAALASAAAAVEGATANESAQRPQSRTSFAIASAPARCLTTLQERSSNNSKPAHNQLPEVWFTAHPPLFFPDPDRPPDDRKVKLGKTLRILQERLPTLLQSPLPQEVLSPHITLHLFPSTHPHLPTVTGRVAYIAALWSSPIAWNRVPLVGNVRLDILSARMVDNPVVTPPPLGREGGGGGLSGTGGAGGAGGAGGGGGVGRPREGARGEQLIVRWRTVGGGGSKILEKLGSGGWLSFVGNGNGKRGRSGESENSSSLRRDNDGGGGGGGIVGKAGAGEEAERGEAPRGPYQGEDTEFKAPVGMAQPARSTDKEFTGLFIFDFDGEGRILNHTIEHVQAGGHWEKGMGAKVVGLTDWLLGGIKGGDAPCPAFSRERFRKER